MCYVLCVQVHAQQVPRSTLHMQHQSSYNPAEVGILGEGDVTLVVREQYMSFPGSTGPSVVWFNASLPLEKLKGGVGLSLFNQTQGFEKRFDFKANYSYRIQLQEGVLGLGLSAGGSSLGWEIKNPVYPDGPTDSYIDSKIAGKENFLNLLLGFGVYYKIKNLYTTFAITEMNQPQLKYDDGTNGSYFKRHYWLSAGYDYRTMNPMITLHPSFLIKNITATTQVSFDGVAQYNSMFLGGISYTSSNDVSLLFGVKFGEGRKFEGMRAIFSYDLVTSKIGAQSSGNLEFMIGYSYSLQIEKVNKSYKSIRFL